MPRIASSLRAIGLLLAGGALVSAGACTAAVTTSDTKPAGSMSPKDLVPNDVRGRGILVVGSDPIFEPMEFMQNGSPAGFDVDLATAIAERLGLKLEYRPTDWGKLLDGVAQKQLDLAMSSITDKSARQQKVTFVDYLHVGSSIVVRNDVREVKGLAGLCGLRVAVQAETMYVDMVNDLAKTCPSSQPLRPVLVDSMPRDAVKAGKADAFMNDFPVAVADVATGGLRIAGQQFEAAPYGIAIAKDRKDLVKAVQGALYELFENGTYDKLIEKWKLTEGSLKTGAINGGA